ncbi:DegV family protein [Fundicoccus culcitae]|uniref:DegV family protein n=1 Tax=Fundicoccus culcitae TaxID=2969821 RepID=A0ABY5PAD9_9LACT|nr:DegV family protein [Fundicoccus culcitae]UUX35415.1 DegV family protein [Fundicoccus culcitae]
MSKIAFVTDSGTGLSVAENAANGFFSVSLQIAFGDKSYREFEEVSYPEVYKQLHNQQVVKTSLPNLGDIEDLFKRIKDEGYTEIFAVPICPGLSGTASAMHTTAQNMDIPFTFFDTGTTALIQRYMLKLAKALSEKGLAVKEILERLEQALEGSNTILIPDDLMHLSRGGRLSKTNAIVGNLIKMKPILQINKATGGKNEVVKTVRTFNKSLQYVIEEQMSALKQTEFDWHVVVAHVDALDLGQKVLDKIQQSFPKASTELIDLVPTVSAHTGLGCIGFQFFRKQELNA